MATFIEVTEVVGWSERFPNTETTDKTIFIRASRVKGLERLNKGNHKVKQVTALDLGADGLLYVHESPTEVIGRIER